MIVYCKISPFKVRILVLMVLQLLVNQNLKAQISGYSFSPIAGGTYTELSGGTILGTASGSSGITSLDDIVYNLPNGTIPFSFIMNNVSYTGCNISSNGFITFGSTAPTATTYSPIASATTYDASISLMGFNLNSYFYSGNALQNGVIGYQTTGVSPNRCFVIQWKNFKPLAIANSPFANGINGQICLYESTNVIELKYNTIKAFTGITCQIGLRGVNNTFSSNVNARAVASAGVWATSTAGTSNAAFCSLNTTFPPSGLVYRFSPPCFAPSNLQVSNPLQNSIKLLWASNVSGTSKVEYGPSGFAVGTGVIVNNATSPLSVSGLTAGTNYQFYVSTNCTSGGTSSASGPFSFTSKRVGDDCATAPTLTLFNGLPAAASFTTVKSGITSDGPNALCSDIFGNLADDDMWFKFVAPATITNKLVITTTAGTNNDWVMEVWSACSGTLLKCSDDVNAGMPEITICQNEYTPGQIFYVRVWTYAQAAPITSDMTMCAYLATSQCVVPPVNDECINAVTLPIGIPLSCPGTAQSFSTNFATTNQGLNLTIAQPTCATGTILDEFFKFNTGFKGNLTLTLKATSAPSIKASLLFDCSGTELQCFTPAPGGSTYTLSGLNDLSDYYIRVWSPSGQSGSFEICLADVCDDSKATLSGSIAICPTGTAQLKVDFTGMAPWNLVYTNGISNFNITTSSNPLTIPVSPTTTTSYNLVSVASQYCSGTVAGTATITLNQPPVVTLAPFAPICENTSLSLSGGSPVGGAYSGPGVFGANFNPSSLGIGTYQITYTYGLGSGCYSSDIKSIIVKKAPSITSFSPGTGSIGSNVIVNGSNFTGANIVRFNTANSISYTITNSSQISATVPVGSTSGNIYIELPSGCSSSSNNIFTIGNAPLFTVLNIKAFIQGFYNSGGHMNAVIDQINKPNVADSIVVSIAQANYPYAKVASSKGVLSTTGYGSFAFNFSFAGNYYYLVLNHRNCIETWSAVPILLSSGTTLFDFTTPRSVLRTSKPLIKSNLSPEKLLLKD